MRPDQPILFVERFGDALEAAAERSIAGRGEIHRRRRRTTALAAALVSLLAGGVLVVVLSASPAAAGVQVEHVGPDVVVRLVDLETDAEGVRKAIADAGLDVEVVSVPVSPSLVGRFISSTGTDSAPDLVLLDVEGDAFRGFRIPQAFGGHLQLRLGRNARPGESYLANGSAYGPGEPLECSGLFGVRVADAVPVLDRLNLTVRWQTPAEGPDGPSMVETTQEAVADLYVTDAISLAPSEILIFVATEPESLFANGLGESESNCP